MQAAAILGLGCSPKNLKPFQSDASVEWRIGLPNSNDEADIVLLFGGDGTIHRHLGPLVSLGLPVLIVPAGSGNDFARALGLESVRRSLAAWQGYCRGDGNVREVDLGVVTPLSSADGTSPSGGRRYFCSVAGVGLDGEVARRANHLPRWLRGHGGYVLSLAPTIFTFAPFPMKIMTPATDSDASEPRWAVRSDQATLLAAFANTPLYGGGMKIAPKARPNDGLLDICVLGGMVPFKLFCMFPTVYAGRHLGIREVQYFQSTQARIETEQPLDVYADGEYVCRTPVEVSIERAALQVITPK
jgi:diacylglycerol kinase (ATP)